MSLQFSTHDTIHGGKYNFIDNVVLRDLIREAGRKKSIIFVEGYDDEVIYGILYEEYLEKLCFIDISFEAEKAVDSELKFTGGCEQVKQHLRDFVQHLSTERRFYGVIDRDLKTDEEVQAEREKPCYDGKLFIFFERYTLENYFVDPNILFDFLKGQSIKHKQLIPLIKNGKENLTKEVIAPILTCLIDIAAANLTIRFFDSSKKFLEDTVSCEEGEIRNRIVQQIKQFQKEDDISSKFSVFQKGLIKQNKPLKFASAKGYFFYQFYLKLKELTDNKVRIAKVDNYKSELARILKRELPHEFYDLLNLINPS